MIVDYDRGAVPGAGPALAGGAGAAKAVASGARRALEHRLATPGTRPPGAREGHNPPRSAAEWSRQHPGTSSPGGFHARSRATGWSPNFEGYNQFSLLEDADDDEDNEGYEEIMVVTEAATTTSWTKVSTIVDSGANAPVVRARPLLSPRWSTPSSSWSLSLLP